MRSLTDESVTQDNFWEKYTEFEKSTYKQAWRELKWRSAFSITLWLINRVIFSGVALPCMFFGILVAVLAWETSWIEALNTVFIGHTEPFTAETVNQIFEVWAVFFFMSFAICIAFAPWKSPAAKQVEWEMGFWWRQHGSKLPMAKYKQKDITQ
ncbi:TPA: hypothetical protein I6696_003491 [Vibrio cholerae]|nr:hypothetical protein [Vibrio cholerae]HDP8606430.1 hypothetical protein [Vibrio cholerae]